MSRYDLRESYADRAAKVMGADMDWETLGLFHRIPTGYHFTKQGQPDKRYSNYPEVQAYWWAELEQRSEWIERANHHPYKYN